MIPLPTAFPSDSVSSLISIVKSRAFVDRKSEFADATWNLFGYGLYAGVGEYTPGVMRSVQTLNDDQAVELAHDLGGAMGGVTEIAFEAIKPLLKWALLKLANSL